MTYFVTGTDTNIGKTVASAWLVHQLHARYWKPIQSGVSEGKDQDAVKALAQCQDEQIIPSTYELQAPLSPHHAAKAANTTIDFHHILQIYYNYNAPHPLIIEGAGGLMVPLNEKYLMMDLLQALEIPAILVTRTTLGTINHTLLSLEALRTRSIPIAGIIAVGDNHPHNLEAIEVYGKVPIVAHLPTLSPLCYETLSLIPFRIPLCY